MSGANGKDKLMGGTAMDPFNPDAAAVERWKNRPKETVELPHTENKIMVTITTYDLVEEDGRYVPAAKMAELSREAILKEAKQSVADAMELHVAAADSPRSALVTMRARVEVRLKIKGAVGFAQVPSNKALSWLFELRDDLVELIEDLQPPESAWVSEAKPLEAQTQVKNERRGNKSGASRGSRGKRKRTKRG